jgi:predicted transcriptional regulator
MENRPIRRQKSERSMTETLETILAKIDAGIRDANEGRFATEEEVQAEFAKWRSKGAGSDINRARSCEPQLTAF